MALTALEWLALPEEERKRRGEELSSHECFLLRTVYEFMPKGPEHYPNGPLQRKEPTEEEMEKFRRDRFTVFRAWGTIPQEVTYDEWKGKGCPLTWKKHD